MKKKMTTVAFKGTPEQEEKLLQPLVQEDLTCMDVLLEDVK